MSQNEEIPCAACQLWNAKTKSFSCNPNSCSKLSEWLIERTPQLNVEITEKSNIPIQYVV